MEYVHWFLTCRYFFEDFTVLKKMSRTRKMYSSLYLMQEENMELKRQKSDVGETLEWTDYMSLTFTQHVINQNILHMLDIPRFTLPYVSDMCV